MITKYSCCTIWISSLCLKNFNIRNLTSLEFPSYLNTPISVLHLLLPIVLIFLAYEHVQILIIQCLPASAALIFEFVEIILGTNNLSAITFVPTQPDQGLPKFILLSFNSPIRILPSYMCCPISVLRLLLHHELLHHAHVLLLLLRGSPLPDTHS